MNSFILETPRLRNIDEILESDKPIEDNAFKNMVNDPEFDEAINEIFEGLRETDEWNDLIDYYIALEYIFGAVDNVFSMEQNHDFGVDLMLKYAAIGNTFCFYAAFAHCWARLFFLSSVAKPGFFVLWVLKERNDTCSFRLERSHDKRAETPD